jgi:glycosyltransferase involved in cell wall biosynthesis
MSKRIHIKIADRGWILEKCASEIVSRANNVSYGIEPDSSADLQYYINYSARSRRVSSTEIAFFTHSEVDPTARRRYFDAAAEVEHCVCMSARYAQELIEQGIPADKVTTIAPGVDLEEFQPKVRIGVVGRTYHTGRKGEALVAEVMDIPQIEWRFTGSGWPGQSVHVADGGMAAFYNDLDYVLVPSLYEGGPMSVLEGLACGVPIISSDVGWVSDYPHIRFENGDADSLRRVLNGVVEERLALRSSVLDCTWSRWAEDHLQLFDRLLERSSAPIMSTDTHDAHRPKVTLVTHGSETSSIGGPSVRVPRTAAELAKLGVDASMPNEHRDNFDDSELAHVFNIWPPESCFKVLDRAHALGKRTVLSPIYLNLSNIQFASKTLPRLFSEGRSPGSIDSALSEIAKELEQEPNLPVREPFEGFHERVRVCIDSADEVIFLSDYERRCIEYIGASPRSATIVRNPVDSDAFASADPLLFAQKFGLDDYILCVGRIEPRKNQLILAHAARTLGKTIVFIGHTENQAYLDLVREVAGSSGRFIPRIDPSDPLLKSAFSGASAFCLPSWAEGAPLAALEAAAAGVPLVLSDRSSEKEYFGDFAEYVNPADINAMRGALEVAASRRGDVDRRAALQKHIAENNSWDKYAHETAAVYEKIVSSTAHQHIVSDPSGSTLYFDLTTTFHASGNPTGIARVEKRALQAMVAQYGDRVVPIVWNSRTKNFVQLSRATALVGTNLMELERMEKLGELPLVAPAEGKGGRRVGLGGSWIRNSEYIAALLALKRELGSNLTVLVHDLIQMKLAHLYPDGIGTEFEENARLVTQAADDFLVYSEFTRADLREFLIRTGEVFKKIAKFRLGDMTGLHVDDSEAGGAPKSELQNRFFGRRFAIYVSTVEIRKNHALLINVWRRLVEERGASAPQLLFIGRSLWRGDEVVDSIRRDEKLRNFVHVLNDVDDRDLDWFYRNCTLTLYPSLYEGWGLPVAESLSYGKVCITSDRTATREIAPTLTDLVDPYDFRAWRDRIGFYLDNPAALERAEEKIRNEYREHSWNQSGREIVSIIDSLPSAQVESAFLFPRQEVEFFASARSGTGTAMCSGGWGNVERGGRWSIGPASKLAFRYPAKGDQFILRLRVHALTRPGQDTRSVRIRINDIVDEVVEISGTPSVLDLTIPVRRRGTAPYSDNEVVFEVLEMFSPSTVSGSADVRMLGVFLVSAQIADDVSELSSPPTPSALPQQLVNGQVSAEALQAAKDLTALPKQFTGKRPLARFARAVAFDKFWLRMHARQFRRAYASINLIVDYLQSEKRA